MTAPELNAVNKAELFARLPASVCAKSFTGANRRQ